MPKMQNETVEILGIKGRNCYELRLYDRHLDHQKTIKVKTNNLDDFMDKNYPNHNKHYFIFTEEEIKEWLQN